MKIIELFEADEDEQQDREIELMHAIKTIKQDCQPFLEQAGGRLLFRGSNSFVSGKGPSKLFQKRTVRTDRKPLSTDLLVHQASDDWFHDEFGIRGRSAAVFATGDHTAANTYGTVYAIFPIGDFKFIWSPVVRDLFVAGRDIHFASQVVPYLEKAGYRDRDLAKAIKSSKEIMIACKEYYMLMSRTAADREKIQSLLDEE